MTEITMFLMSAGAIVRIYHLFLSTLTISNIISWTIEVDMSVGILMWVMSRTRGYLNRVFSLSANGLVL
jgi:hypothetical protein